jgi:hypothetical protein
VWGGSGFPREETHARARDHTRVPEPSAVSCQLSLRRTHTALGGRRASGRSTRARSEHTCSEPSAVSCQPSLRHCVWGRPGSEGRHTRAPREHIVFRSCQLVAVSCRCTPRVSGHNQGRTHAHVNTRVPSCSCQLSLSLTHTLRVGRLRLQNTHAHVNTRLPSLALPARAHACGAGCREPPHFIALLPL